MIVGYWQRGENCMHTHALHDTHSQRPGCGVLIAADAIRVRWSGELAHIDCRRCLRMLRKETRERIAAIEKRLDGKGGVQRDAFDKAR